MSQLLPDQGAIDLLNSIVADAGGQRQLSTSQILQSVLNLVMRAERSLHLEQHPQDKANGYYSRELGSPNGTLQIQVPRDRQGEFRPQVLPEPYQRDLPERLTLLEELLQASYSPNQIQRLFKGVGLHYNPQEMERLKDHYLQEFHHWQTRELPHDMIGIFIDAYKAQILHQGKVRTVTAFSVLGVDFNGHKDLLGFYISLGNETKSFWLQVLNDLIDRGLKRLIMVVSDDFSGLKEAVQTLFPQALHQLCFIHMQRNVRRNMGKDDAQVFNQELGQIRLINHFQEGVERFSQLTQTYLKKYPSFIKAIQDDIPNYLAFLKLPQGVQIHFYTTNAAESFNSGLEKIRSRMGGFFQSDSALYLNVYLYYHQLKHKWKKGIPHIKANLYLLRQLFAQLYDEPPHG